MRANPFAFGELAADDVSRAFGGDEDDVDIGGGHDGLVVDGEAVAEEEGFPFFQVGSDVLVINRRDLGIGYGDEDDVGLLHGGGGVHHFKPEFLGDRDGSASFVEANDDVGTALLEIEGVGVALGTEADYGEGFPFEEGEIGVFVRVNFGGHEVCC